MENFKAYVLYSVTEKISGISEDCESGFDSMLDAWTFATKLNTDKSHLVVYSKVRMELDFNHQAESTIEESGLKNDILNMLTGE